MGVPTNKLHGCGYVSIGCEPCTRPVLPTQHEREGRWWWEDSTGTAVILSGIGCTLLDHVHSQCALYTILMRTKTTL